MKLALAALCLLSACEASATGTEHAAVVEAPKPVAAPTPPPPPAPPPQPPCDGYDFSIGRATATELRYCVGRQAVACWSFDGKTFTPIDTAAVLSGSGDVLDAYASMATSPTARQGAWHSTVDDQQVVHVCHDDDCHPLALGKVTGPKKWEDAVDSTWTSPDGAHVAVLRGVDLSTVTIEIYDRVSGKRTMQKHLGTCGKLYGFAGDLAVVGLWCANQGDGGRVLVAPDGQIIPVIGGGYGNEPFGSLGNGKWGFVGEYPHRLHVYDVATREHVDGMALPEHDGNDNIAFGNERMYAFGYDGSLSIYDATLAPIATAHAPSCKPQK